MTFDCMVADHVSLIAAEGLLFRPLDSSEPRGETHGDKKLYRIGELAKIASVSERTIDYYTKLGLITPEERSLKNYRLYNDETLVRLERINQMKQDKYSLDEIKQTLHKWNEACGEEEVTDKLTSLQMHMQRLEREVHELQPLLKDLKPVQARKVLTGLLPQSAACIEALKYLLERSTMM